MTKEVRVYDIDWDTDGEQVDLPTEMHVIIEPDEVDNSGDEEAVSEYLSDLISDQIGWCHGGFRWEYTGTLIKVWVMTAFDEEERTHKQPPATVFGSKERALQMYVETSLDGLDKDEQAEHRARIQADAEALRTEGDCRTYDGWFVMLREEQVR